MALSDLSSWRRCSERSGFHTWGNGPLLCMACTSPARFNWFLCTITAKISVPQQLTYVFFQTQTQENLHKPFEWQSKINTTHTHTHTHTPAHLKFSLI